VGAARIAIRATEAKTRLLQDINLIDRTIGTLFIDDGKPVERISGAELQKRFDAINVTDAELVSEAEVAWLYDDAAASEAAAQAASDSAESSRD
jgi:hypothetical protein